DWRVDHPSFAEFAEQPLGDAENAAIGVALAFRGGAAGDILADHDDARIAAHLLAQCLAERLTDRFLRHQNLHREGTRRSGRDVRTRYAKASCTLSSLRVPRVPI